MVLWLTHKQCAFLGPGVAGAGEFERPSAHTTLKSFEFHAAGRGLSVCTRGDVLLSQLDELRASTSFI